MRHDGTSWQVEDLTRTSSPSTAHTLRQSASVVAQVAKWVRDISASVWTSTSATMAMPRVAHVQVPSDEGEEMLLEVETLNTAKPRHWYFAGAGLALLVVLGVAAKVLYRSPETSLKTKDFDINTIQEWEQIPGIDTVVEHAKTLELKQPLRNLNDLFYESQPEELPWIRTECVIDVIQGAAYLGQAVVFLYKAIKYDGIRCPNNSEAGCAASIAGFITSATNSASVYTLNFFVFGLRAQGGPPFYTQQWRPNPAQKRFNFSLFFLGGLEGYKETNWVRLRGSPPTCPLQQTPAVQPWTPVPFALATGLLWWPTSVKWPRWVRLWRRIATSARTGLLSSRSLALVMQDCSSAQLNPCTHRLTHSHFYSYIRLYTYIIHRHM